MALPSSGPIRLGADVNVELGLSAAAQISLGSAGVRGLYGVSSGAIRLAADGYGKSSTFFATIATNQTNLNLRDWAIANGWNGTSSIVITIAGGVNILSNNTGIVALTINGSWPNGVTLINNGNIVGRGGNGGIGGRAPAERGGNGTAGGTALSVLVSASINNISNIAGGGGGGGGGGGRFSEGWYGGGGGGGAAFGTGASAYGGAGNGTLTTGGARGLSSSPLDYGGNGGGWGATGNSGSASFSGFQGSGGSAGAAVTGSSNITWIAMGSIYGGVI